MYRYLAATLLLLSSPALAAHPLPVDDAGTVPAGKWELELALARVEPDPELGPIHGYSVATRLGLSPRFDAGVALAWAGEPAAGRRLETIVDLKFVQGIADGWRPCAFIRSDFAFASGAAQADAHRVAVAGGLTWELPSLVVTSELGRTELRGGTWVAAAGAYGRIRPRLWLAAAWSQGSIADVSSGAASAGMVVEFESGDLSLGFEVPAERAVLDETVLLLGWTGTFSR